VPYRTTKLWRSVIDVELRPLRFPLFAAVVGLRGEHDMATASAIAAALDSIFGDVLVDFSECGFCDASVVRVLFESADARQREGQRLELLIPHCNTPVARIFEITGLSRRLTTHADVHRISAEPATSAAP
jgi:anti-anti-sigma factor